MNLNNTAVKPKNEVEEKVAIAIYAAAGFENQSNIYGKLPAHPFVGARRESIGYWTNECRDLQIITLDQLIWGSGVAPDDNCNYLCWVEHDNRIAWFEHKKNMYEGAQLISTRPQQEKTKQYMPEVGEEFMTSIGKYKCIAHGVHNGKTAVVGQGPDCIHNFALSAIKPLKTKEEEEREEFRGVLIDDLGELNSCITDHSKVFDLIFDKGYRKIPNQKL